MSVQGDPFDHIHHDGDSDDGDSDDPGELDDEADAEDLDFEAPVSEQQDTDAVVWFNWLKNLVPKRQCQKMQDVLSNEVRELIGKFIGPCYATYCSGWPHSFKSNWWTDFNQKYQYGNFFPRTSYTPQLENGSYTARHLLYFQFGQYTNNNDTVVGRFVKKDGWRVPIFSSFHDLDFVLRLKYCFNQLGLNDKLIIGQIVGMPDNVCTSIFSK